MKSLEAISSSEVRQWKQLTARLLPGKSFLVENHGQPEAVIMHPADVLDGGGFDLPAHFARVLGEAPTAPLVPRRAPEL